MGSSAIEWALWAAAAVLAATAAVTLVWALRGDRARGRRRCPRCWYDMQGVRTEAAPRCPECGYVAKSEKQLRRTRRRWKWAGVAIITAVAALGLWMTPGAINQGWPGAIPSAMLVTQWPTPVKDWVAKHVDMQVVNDPVLKELDRRIDAGELSGWHARRWTRRVEVSLSGASRLGIEGEQEVLSALETKRLTTSFAADRLESVIGKLADQLDISIHPRWDELAVEGLSPETLISMSIVEASGMETIDALTGVMGEDHASPVWWWVRDGRVTLGVWNGRGSELPVCVYRLDGLIDGGEDVWRMTDGGVMGIGDRAAGVKRVLGSMADAENWVIAGGERNTMAVVARNAIVRAPARTQREVSRVLAAMERALAEGGAASVDEDEWSDARRTSQRLRDAKMGFADGSVGIEDLVSGAAAACDVRIDVDWSGLAAVRVQPQLGVETTTGEMSVEAALDKYVGGLVHESLAGVSWTIHRGVVRIATRDRVGASAMVRVYNVSDLLGRDVRGHGAVGGSERGDETSSALTRRTSPRVCLEVEAHEAVATRIMETVDPDGWVRHGGDTGVVSEFGPCLVVRTTARNHLAIEDLLQKMRDERRQ